MTVSFVTQTLMEAMGLIAIIVNCYLIGQCGQLQRLFPWLSPEMAIISIVILEVHTLLHTYTCGTVPQAFYFLQYSSTYLFNIFSTLQHFAVLLKYVIHVAIPDIPSWVSEEMAKLEFQRREAFKVDLVHKQSSAIFNIFHFSCWYVMNVCLVPARSMSAKHSSTSSNSRGEKEKRKNGSGKLSTRPGVRETMGGLTPLEGTTIMKRAKEANPDRPEGVEAL